MEETVIFEHLENLGFETELPVIPEEELEDSVSQYDLIEGREMVKYNLSIIKKFVEKTKEYLNTTFEKIDNNTWQDKTSLIKNLSFNHFVIIKHGDDYLFKDTYQVLDIQDFNLIVDKTKNK